MSEVRPGGSPIWNGAGCAEDLREVHPEMLAGASSHERRPKATLILPFILVGILVVFLFVKLRSGEPPDRLPSALIGKPVPEFDLPAIPRVLNDYGPLPGLSSAALKTGHASILNVWASWCAPCAAEIPQLIELAQQGVPLFGIDYKDTSEAARGFLARHGNPFRAIGADEKGLTAVDLGVYGVPETFIVDGAGIVVYRFPGPLTPEVVSEKIVPALRKAGANVSVNR
jgi:cytochrome c biogenesis protein CcmG/thiol:disulfide interchange protein DsbE